MSTHRAARIATYPMRTKEGRDLSCIRGPIAEARALRDTTLAAAPGAVVRYETINHGIDEYYCEIVMPEAKS